MDRWLPVPLEALLLVLAAAAALAWLALWRGHGGVRVRRMARTACVLCVGLLLARAWLVEPFFVPSASMAPTLLEGDLILVQKFPYRLAWPVGEQPMWVTGSPARGEVVVFSLPQDRRVRYVKRVIGLPGDEVALVGGQWLVNGRALAGERSGRFHDVRGGQRAQGWEQARQSLAGQGFSVIVPPVQEPSVAHWTVPEGHVFVLGDNRGDSQDSRAFGFVPMPLILGRVGRVVMNLRGHDRFGLPVHQAP